MTPETLKSWQTCVRCGQLKYHLSECGYNNAGVGLEIDSKRSPVLDSERRKSMPMDYDMEDFWAD